MPKENDLEKLLSFGKSATAKTYQSLLQKIAAGKVLTAAELKAKKSLEAELEAQQAKTETGKSAKKKKAIVTTATLCGIFGIFPSQISIWKRDEDAGIAEIDRNRWDANAFLEWWLENKYNPIDPNDPDAREYHNRWEKARAEKIELQVAMLKGEVMPKDEIHREWAARMAIIINGLTVYQDRLPPLLEGKTKGEMRAIIKGENHRLRDWYCKQGK